MNYHHFLQGPGSHKQESFHYQPRHPVLSGSLPVTIPVAGVSRWVGDTRMDRKNCDGFVVELITYGSSTFVQNRREYHLKQGDVYLLQPGADHTYRTGSGGVVHKRFVEIAGPILSSLLRTMELNGRDTVRPKEPAAIAALMRMAMAVLERKEPNWSRELSTIAYRILVLLSEDLLPRYPPALSSALSYIDCNFAGPVSLSQLCRKVDLSPTHLCRIFKQHLGTTPVKFITRQRMTWAQRLLVTQAASIKEIAVMVGYDDQLYFSSRFRRYTGMSPKAFRLSKRG